MNTSKRLKATRSPKRSIPQPVDDPATLTPEQQDQTETRALGKWDAYRAEQERRRTANHRRIVDAIKTVHRLMEEAEWFKQNTPIPFVHVYSSSVGAIAELACESLEHLALHGNHSAIKTLARLTVQMTEGLTDLLWGESAAANENARLMQPLACQLPYWPMLVFKHADANNHFVRIAQKVRLGEKDCPINVSEKAKYSLQTPINYFVWKCLRHFQKVHSIVWQSLDTSYSTPTLKQLVKCKPNLRSALREEYGSRIDEILERMIRHDVCRPIDKRVIRVGLIAQEAKETYKNALFLEPLTKVTAKEWADVVIMPYVDTLCPVYDSFFRVPEFKAILRRQRVKSLGTARAEVHKAILKSVTSIAPATCISGPARS